MAQIPVTWNGKDAQGNPLRWNTPGLTWNGFLPQPKPAKPMSQLRVLLGFASAADHSLEETATAVSMKLYGNADFPTPPVAAADFTTALTAFTNAIATAQQGGPADTADKNAKREVLIGLMRQLAGYVQSNCGNELAKRERSSGNDTARLHPAPPHPLRSYAGLSIGAKLIWQKVTDSNEVYETEEQFIQLGEEQDAVHQDVIAMAKFMNDFIAPLAPMGPAQLQLQIDLLTGAWQGNLAAAAQTALNSSETHRRVFSLVSGALAEMKNDYKDGTPGQKGYITGRIVFEAASMVFAYTKLGKLAQLKKVAFLEKILSTKICGPNMRRAFRPLIVLLNKAGACFVAGTLVRTLEGLLPIEQVRAGMYVWSRDEETGETGWKRVMQTFITHPSVIHHLTYELRGPPESGASVPLAAGEAASRGLALQTETLSATAPHPFYVRNRETPGFIAAEELQPGDELFLSGHRQAVVVSSIAENSSAGETFTTYNFEVEDFHTYFVGQSGVWVHNFSKKFCDELVEHLDLIRKRMGIPDGVSLDGKKFDIFEEGMADLARTGKPLASKHANFAMHVTGAEELEAYARRFPNGSANNPVEEIASFTRQDRIRQTFQGASKSEHYEIHHLSEKRVSRALGIPEKTPDGISIWDSSPSINLPERPGGSGFDASDMNHYLEKYGHGPVFHQGGNGNGIAQAIGKIFTDMGIKYTDNLSLPQKRQLVRRLCHLYQHDPRYSHLQAWPATRDWLRRHVDVNLVPDHVDPGEFPIFKP